MGQPVTRLYCQVQVAQDTPQILRFRNLKGMFFGGTVGGEALPQTDQFQLVRRAPQPGK